MLWYSLCPNKMDRLFGLLSEAVPTLDGRCDGRELVYWIKPWRRAMLRLRSRSCRLPVPNSHFTKWGDLHVYLTWEEYASNYRMGI